MQCTSILCLVLCAGMRSLVWGLCGARTMPERDGNKHCLLKGQLLYETQCQSCLEIKPNVAERERERLLSQVHYQQHLGVWSNANIEVIVRSVISFVRDISHLNSLSFHVFFVYGGKDILI